MPISCMKKNKGIIVVQPIIVVQKKQLIYVYKKIIKYFSGINESRQKCITMILYFHCIPHKKLK